MKKLIRKIQVVSKDAMSHDKQRRKSLLQSFQTRYTREKEEGDLKSLQHFRDKLGHFLAAMETEMAPYQSQQAAADDPVRIVGCYQEIHSLDPFLPAEPEETEPQGPSPLVPDSSPGADVDIRPGAEGELDASDKRRWNDYKDREEMKQGKFTEPEIEKLKHALCKYVKVGTAQTGVGARPGSGRADQAVQQSN